MDKKKTSKKQGASSIKDMPIVKLKDSVKTVKHDPTKNLKDPELIAQALAECLLNGEKEEFIEILLSHWEAKNLKKSLEEVGLSRRTFYAIKKSQNPELETIMKLTKGLKAV